MNFLPYHEQINILQSFNSHFSHLLIFSSFGFYIEHVSVSTLSFDI